MSLKLNSSGGGSVTLQEPSTASNRTLTLPDNTGNLISSADSGTVSQAMLASGVAGTGPAFSAYANANQTASSATFTKVNLDTEVFDTGNCFNTSTYRFTPNISGYYQISGALRIDNSNVFGSAITMIFKNGSELCRGQIGGTLSYVGMPVSAIVYLNGTTDYVELYAYQDTGSPRTIVGGSIHTYFTGALIRAA